MTENRFEIKIGEFEEENIVDNLNKRTIHEISDMCKKMNESYEENKRLKRINKGQELEIVRLYNLADVMSSVLRELGIYNVYDDETIEEVKNKVKGDVE